MSNLKEVAELSWNKVFPAGSKAPVSKEAFIRTAYNEFAFQSLLMAWKEKADDYYEVPSYLLTEVEKTVVNNEIDISDLKYFKSLPMAVWLQGVDGGVNCECKYIKSTYNLSQLLCEDDSLADADKTYYALGKKLVFPKGTHANKLKITYANIGEDINGDIEIDEAIASLVRDKLDAIYLGKVPPTDTTNQNNPNN